MAILLWQRTHCVNCGTTEDEWNEKKGGSRHAYIPQIYVCQGCQTGGDALDAAIQSRHSAKKTTAGVQVRLIPADDLKAIQEMERGEKEAKFLGLGGNPNQLPSNMRSLGGR